MVAEIENFLKNILGNDYNSIKTEQYKNVSLSEYFERHEENIRNFLYDKLISDTTDNDPTVLKTITNYYPTIVYNTSNIHFILHNAYSTLNYYIPNNQKVSFSDVPTIIIEPISNNLCICLILQKDEVDLTKKEFKLKIEQWNEDELIKQFFIDRYITPHATSFVVDNTNLKYIKGKING